MHEYEVLIETINPCGGEAHAAREFKQIEAASPEGMLRRRGVIPFWIPAKTPPATPLSPRATARAS